MQLVNPDILFALFSRGFYAAFRRNADTKDYAVIATIQGYDPEILVLLMDSWRWLAGEMAAGRIACDVVIKKEDIISYALFGPAAKIQRVVAPMSLVSTHQDLATRLT